jgi:LysR family transcriptional regulator, transcriptional activator of nhaA
VKKIPKNLERVTRKFTSYKFCILLINTIILIPMKNWINYHHLLYFKLIAEEGSVSKAAQILRLGQPTLSTQLKQFEDSLGVPLFERQHKKLILTEQGKIALEYAKTIFNTGNEMYEVLHDKIVPSRINLQIGALDSIPKQVILQLTQDAYALGNCHITLIEGRPDEMIRELTAHKLDLFITNFVPTSEMAKGIMHKSISKKPVDIYGAPKFKKLRKGFPKSLLGEQIIVPSYDSKLRYDLEHWSKTRAIILDIIAETQDIALKKLMAVEGLGLIPAAYHTVERQVLGGELVKIGTLEGVVEELFLVSAQRKRVNLLASTLMKNFSLQ